MTWKRWCTEGCIWMNPLRTKIAKIVRRGMLEITPCVRCMMYRAPSGAGRNVRETFEESRTSGGQGGLKIPQYRQNVFCPWTKDIYPVRVAPAIGAKGLWYIYLKEIKMDAFYGLEYTLLCSKWRPYRALISSFSSAGREVRCSILCSA